MGRGPGLRQGFVEVASAARTIWPRLGGEALGAPAEKIEVMKAAPDRALGVEQVQRGEAGAPKAPEGAS